MIYESTAEKVSSLDIPIPLGCIERVTLSPWMPAALVPHVKDRLTSIKGCSDLEIVRSTLISSEEWKNRGDEAE